MNETRSMRAGPSRKRRSKTPLAVIGLMMAAWSLPTMASATVFSTVGNLVGDATGSFTSSTYHFTLSSLAPSYTATLTDTGLFGADPIGMSVLSPSMKLLGTQMGSGSFNFTADELGTYTLAVAGKPKTPNNFDVFGASIVDGTRAVVDGAPAVVDGIPGGTQVAAVPEVNTWLMLLVGLGMMAFRLGGRRGEATAYPA